MTVYGNLLAEGTATAPVTFTSDLSSPQAGDWRGIRFFECGDSGWLRHIQVEYALAGIAVEAENTTASPVVEHAVIAQNWRGVEVGAGSGSQDAYARPQILSSTISQNSDYGVFVLGHGGLNRYADGFAEPLILNNTISDNGSAGIYLRGEGGSAADADGYANADIVSNTVANNASYGIYCYGDGGD